MKKLLPFIIFSLIINIAAAEDPEIVWENSYTPQDQGNVKSNAIYNFDDTLYIGYTAKNYSSMATVFNAYALRVDGKGKIIDNIHWNTKEDMKFYKIKKSKDGFTCYFTSYFMGKKPIILKSDHNGNINHQYMYKYTTDRYYNWRNDSLFYFGRSKERVNNKYYPYHYICAIDPTLQKTEIIVLDSNSIDVSVNYWSSCGGGPSSDGSFIVAEYGPKGKDYNDFEYSIISKYSRNGKAIWTTKLDNPNDSNIYINKLVELENGSIICTGYVIDKQDNNDLFICKLTKDGVILWMNCIDEPKKSGFKKLWDGKYFASFDMHIDESNKDNSTFFYLTLFDSEGNFLEKYMWQRDKYKNRIFDVIEFDNDLVVTGSNGEEEIYVARIRPKFLDVNEQQSAPALSLHPNPATDIINISGDMGYNERVEIYTLEGVCLHSGRGRRIDVSHLARGVYFVRVGAESLRFVKM